MKIIISLLALFALSLPAHASDPNENDYVQKFCKGAIEVTVIGRFRIDCVDGMYAIEYDWAYKWAECIGQSLKYAQTLGKAASCVLIVKTEKDEQKVLDTYTLIEHFRLPIKLYTVKWDDKETKLFEY